MSGNQARRWAGVVLGGTGTRAVIVDDAGQVLTGVTMATKAFGDDAVVSLARMLDDLAGGDHLAGVGIGASGPVDLTTGRIHNPDRLPQFTDVDIARRLESAVAAPVWIDNDAVAAGLAEAEWGPAAGVDPLLCVTLDAAIEVVLIEAGQPRRTAEGQHSQGGHLKVPGSGAPCYCGVRQCWEQVASGAALARLRGQCGGCADCPWTEYARRVASGLITLATLYHPAAIVIGGSVIQHWADFGEPLWRAMSRSREFDRETLLAPSILGERGGVFGSALLPQREIGWHPGALAGVG